MQLIAQNGVHLVTLDNFAVNLIVPLHKGALRKVYDLINHAIFWQKQRLSIWKQR